MKKIILIFIAVFFTVLNLYAGNIQYETSYLKMEIDEKGYVVSIYDKLKNREYLPEGQASPLLSIRSNGEIEQPSVLKKNGKKLTLMFSKNNVEAQINVAVNLGYISFELSA